MRINTYWDETLNAVIRSDFPLNWTWDDFLIGHDTMLALADEIEQHSGGQRFDWIVNFTTPMHNLPKGNMMPIIAQIQRKTPQNAGLLIVVGAGSFITALVSVLERMGMRAGKTRFVSTLSEAYALLNADRAQV